MVREPRIVAFGSAGEQPQDEHVEAVENAASFEQDVPWDAPEPEEPRTRRGQWIAPVLALLAVAAWTGFFAWANRTTLSTGGTPEQWSGWISQWTMPVLLIAVAWLLAMRTSRREADRFGDAARLLDLESARLQERLTIVNRELSLAREFISAQSRDLESLGRVAVERISQHADRLQGLVRDNGAQVDAIAGVSRNALDNMEQLRGQLPVIASSAKDVTNHIGNAGRTAHARLQEMIDGLKRLNEFGSAGERHVETFRASVDAAVTEFQHHAEQLGTIAEQRFAALGERGEAFRHQLDAQEVEALAAIRTRAATLAEELEQSRNQLDAHEAESLTSLRARLSTMRDEGAAISRSLRDGESTALQAWQAAVERLEGEVRSRLAAIDALDQQAMAAARTRIEELAKEAAQVDERLVERNRLFAAEIERRREDAETAEAAALDALRQRLDALDSELAQRRTAARDSEAEALAGLHNRLDALDGEIGRRRSVGADWEAEAVAALHERLDQLDHELERRRAQANDDEADALAGMQARLEELDRQLVERRTAAIASEAEDVIAFRTLLNELDRELAQRRVSADAGQREALAALQAGLEELDRGLATRRTTIGTDHEQALAALRARLAEFDQQIAARRAGHEEQTRIILAHGEAIEAQLVRYDEHLRDIAAQGARTETGLVNGLDTLAGKLQASRDSLAGIETAVSALTNDSVRLLELIHASAQHSEQELPRALSAGEQTLQSLENRVLALRETLGDAQDRGEALSSHVVAARDSLADTVAELAEAQQELAAANGENSAALAGLRGELSEIQGATAALADRAQGELRSAIEQLSGAAREAIEGIETLGNERVAGLAARLGSDSAAALERTLRARSAEALGQLEQAAAHASGVGREAAIQLRDQLAKVDELAGNLERRVAHAKQRAEEQVDNDFARRVALITESLNSNAIDIAKALSTEVTDTAWASYMRGDRGIFTRRAVRLLEPSEARSIAQLYESDGEFRGHVSRYIHDFESMLRQLLSTRDGHAVGVTLLSSDMGKLYVALAQGIERLRA